MSPKILGAIAVTTEHLQTIARLSLPSPGCYNQCAVHRRVRRRSRRKKGKIRNEWTDGRTDGRTVRKRFLVDAISNEHRHRSRCARSGRKQVSRSKRNRTIIGIRPISAGLLFFEDLPLFFFFALHYILANRKNENVSDNSFCNDPRARDVLQSLSRSFMRSLVLAYSSFRNFSLSNSLSLSLFSSQHPLISIIRVFLG